MKFKIAGLASTALLLISPIAGAMTSVANANTVHADNNWDYDVDNPGLGSYDALLQNAGPTDGIVDWYPTKAAVGENPTPQDLVQNLIDLSIATNDATSNARKVLFNDTTGSYNGTHPEYADTFDKYGLALGFIAQILNMNNSKSGLGAKLEQGADPSGSMDLAGSDGKSIITERIQKNPKDHASSIGKNISDVLGTAFFGNADDAYAQIYVNGYDNVSQNAENIIREATSSITIVAQSKSTGKKATAVFKLNNKTLPKLADGSLLNNYIDGSMYALEKDNNGKDIAGLNLTTATKSEIDNIKFSKKSTFWADGNGDGTIVVPRGTTAKQIADLIAKKKLDGNNSYRETAPMKAIQNADGTPLEGISGTHGYNHLIENAGAGGSLSSYNNNIVNGIFHSLKGPDGDTGHFVESSNDFNGNNQWFGGTINGSVRNAESMVDTNSIFIDWNSNKSASIIPNANISEANPFGIDPYVLKIPDSMKPNKAFDVPNTAALDNDTNKKSNIGKVGHLFKPASFIKESYDANHFVNGDPEFKDSDSSKIAQSIVSNGSFSGTNSNASIKKSFTYEAPVNTWMYKSYNNPYSTVVSSQGAEKLNSDSTTEDTITPQEAVDLADPNNDKPNLNSATTLKLNPGQAEVVYTGEKNGNKVYYYVGTYDEGTDTLTIDLPNTAVGSITIEDNDAYPYGALMKYGAVGTDGADLVLPPSPPTQGGIAKLPNPGEPLSGVYRASEFNTGGAYSLDFGTNLSSSATDRDRTLAPYVKKKLSKNQSMFFVQTWDKNVVTKSGEFKPLIYNTNFGNISGSGGSSTFLGKVDSPNFESKYYIEGVIEVNSSGTAVSKYTINDHAVQSSDTKKASFNSNLYNYVHSGFADTDINNVTNKTKNNSRFFVSQDFSVGPVSSDLVSKTGDSAVDSDPNKILETVAKNSDPTKAGTLNDDTEPAKAEFTAENGYKLVTLDEAAEKQGTTVDALANEVAKTTGKSLDLVKRTKWLEASLPRLRDNAGTARINVVVYDKEAVPAPTKQDTKPSFSTTDVSGGNDPFNVSFRPYTTTYDDGAVLKSSDVPDNFKNLLTKTLVAGNPDLVDSTGKVFTNKLQQVLISSFLGSWQQNDGSFKQTDSTRGVSSPLYMYGGFGISNSDTKNSYTQWPKGYTDNSGDYNSAVNSFSGDFYRGGADLKTADGKSAIKGIPFSAITVDTTKLDLTKAGTYPVVYTYTNPDNAKDTASITVPVNVTDSSAPVFAFQGSTNSTINVGDSFNEKEYKVVGSWAIFNNYGGDYSKLPNFEGIAKNGDGTPQVTITGHVDTRTPGIYQLTYKATSITGSTTTMIRNITVLAKDNASDWSVTPNKMVGYINYVPGYGIMVYNAPQVEQPVKGYPTEQRGRSVKKLLIQKVKSTTQSAAASGLMGSMCRSRQLTR
ncbi:immunoglobulin-like domain-containing protein [Xylocopilactobacillus apis]|uniref:DUF5011 domain-containing protein n=1 Tax=Xylocopilactobacillus apis TaxID=2932183 RepID=A0AAU9DP29_9LACO|nr:immunoglobulin-like domain-containing protein [Xylocopilactobacillus apis]BDR57529.1 hypothetical protein KIMC2_20910 [Xylocopilactobacillus apis]